MIDALRLNVQWDLRLFGWIGFDWHNVLPLT